MFWLAGFLVGMGVVGALIMRTFVIDALTDERAVVSGEKIESALGYFPDSSALHGRRAEMELRMAERDLTKAEYHGYRAACLSPNHHRPWLLLGLIRESKGDRNAAEEALRTARTLAPRDKTVNWELAHLLVRAGKLAEAIEPFRQVGRNDASLLPAIFDLIWQSSRHDLKMMRDVAGEDQGALSVLSFALLKASEPGAALTVFESIDRNEQPPSGRDGEFLSALIAEGRFQEARRAWGHIMKEVPLPEAGLSAIWNPGFEAENYSGLGHFDWVLQESEYALPVIVKGTAHSGSRSLRVTFKGRDTLRLDREISLLVLVRPGTRYRLECVVRSRDLVSPEGPRIVVTRPGSADWVAASTPVAAGANDWQPLAVEFFAPGETSMRVAPLVVSLKRKPMYSFDEPTRGTLWLDDFKLTEMRWKQ